MARLYNEIFRSAALLFISFLTLATASIRISDGSSSDVSFPGSYLVFGDFPFDITAPLELISDYDTCSPLSIDLTGKIAVINASSVCMTSAVQDTLSARAINVKDANAEGVVFIIRDNELGRAYLTAGANYQLFDIAILLVSRDDGVKLTEIILQANSTITGQIVSDSSPILDVGRSPGQIVLTSVCLLCDVAALVFVIVQLRLYFRKSTAAISQIALILLLISCIAMIIERILTITFLFVHPFNMGPITGVLVLGIVFVIFAATFIALYWSSLVFPKKRQELKSVKLFVPLLVFFGACFVIYFVTVNLGVSKIYSILEYIYVALLGLLACYFIVIGILLIRAMASYDKAIQTKRVTRRLQVAMMLTGFSLICLLAVAVQSIQPPYSIDQAVFWTIRGLINIITMASVSALAFLFRNPSSQPPSKSSHGDQHSRNIDNSSTTIGPMTPRGKEMSTIA